ncbi:MAG: hypothetical protein KDA28_14025, partial [Phycisphaerales bacterium]|nr:hypothetical protein [Phycisphaerales bacterium]
IGETFTLIGSAPRLDRDGKQVAILASGNMGSQGIFIKPDGSFLQMLVGAGDAAPPTFANDFDQIFGDMALDNGAMAFVATTTADANVRLYSNLGGQTKLVLQPGDMLDGKTVMGVQGVSNQGISGSTIIFSVSFDDSSEAIYTATLLQETVETEPNNAIEDANCIEILSDCVFINGKLQHNEYKACDPDTVLCAFDKQGAFLVDGSGFPRINDDDAGAGDGRGSALWDIPLVYNNGSSGPSTLRLGVTGAGDIVEGMGGNNGVFNGLIQNAPHEQLGQFTLTVTFVDDQGVALPSPAMLPDGSEIMNPFETVEEFQSGSEAFFFNFVSPVGADAAHAVVDNTTGRIDVCN